MTLSRFESKIGILSEYLEYKKYAENNVIPKIFYLECEGEGI